jgi:hypothetical protein
MAIQCEQGSHKYLNVYLTNAGVPETDLRSSHVKVQYQKQGQRDLTTKYLDRQETALSASIDGDDEVLYVTDSSIFPSDFGPIVLDPGNTNEELFEVKRNLVASGRVELLAVPQADAIDPRETAITGNTSTVLIDKATGTPFAGQDLSGLLLRIKTSVYTNETRVIQSNTDNTITLADPIGTGGDLDGVKYEILESATHTFDAQPGVENARIPLPTDYLLTTNPIAMVDFVIAVVDGAGKGQRRRIVSNSISFVIPSTPFSETNPVGDTSVFQIQHNRSHPISTVSRLLDWEEVGGGIYSILFQGSELDTLDAFTWYTETTTIAEETETLPNGLDKLVGPSAESEARTFDAVVPIQIDVITVASSSLNSTTPADTLLKCRLLGNTTTLAGAPLEGIAVQARIIATPQLISDIGVGTATVSARTNTNGSFELILLRGAVVDLVIPELNYRRTLTVPQQDVADLFAVP